MGLRTQSKTTNASVSDAAHREMKAAPVASKKKAKKKKKKKMSSSK